MQIFFTILTSNILPIFIIISLGFLLSKKFKLNVSTLSKLNFYIFVPGFVFFNIYTTKIPMEMIKVLLFAICIVAINGIVANIIGKIKGYNKPMRNALKNALMFYNSGNIGLPLITLVFSTGPFLINGKTPYLNIAVTAQIMILVFQNISTNSIGFYIAGSAQNSWKKSLKKVFSMPTIYTVPLAFICKTIDYDLTKSIIWPVVDYIRSGMVSIALISLGSQLSYTKFDFSNKDSYIAAAIRLIGGPVLALGLIFIFGFNGVVAQALMISTAVPTALNTALIAVECNNCEDFASQTVMLSTLFSAATLTFVIYTARIIFPVV